MTKQPQDKNLLQTQNLHTIAPSTTAAITIAVIGDVHDRWDADDAIALKQLGVDLVLLVGDFGNESVAIVQSIAALDLPKAAVLGNHDAWYSATEWGIKKCPYDRTREDRVQQQLDLLGESARWLWQARFPCLQSDCCG